VAASPQLGGQPVEAPAAVPAAVNEDEPRHRVGVCRGGP
jgi:hypothetical protein